MDRNVFVAIALSMSVLLFWGAFFETPKKTSEQQTDQKLEQKTKQNSIAPTINQPLIININDITYRGSFASLDT